ASFFPISEFPIVTSAAAEYYAKQQGRECNSPRACFKLAFELKLIDDEEQWLQTINDRNEAAHIYREQIAEGVYSRLGNYVTLFELLLSKMRE
ncbi:MAG: Nucleotidyltransferase substrate binding protein, HI0074 family, partial [Parcubacteria group bacterium GW2011_GWA2_47_8]